MYAFFLKKAHVFISPPLNSVKTLVKVVKIFLLLSMLNPDVVLAQLVIAAEGGTTPAGEV
ncbi:hypothetical protein KP77_23810 [Jeotgalibacillus alimentarius]|uniref:Uncharacterized protein n=1 Tax=Jeotgalibacillus alimentarius TaxID=135826 RepID=A0A0C2VEC1_9BACL|nr:hypothetical protein KP77_23810 [Jeotgalibacillus alimentarius]